jgi:hypothetical protein
LTEGKNRCRITAHNLPIPLEKKEFVTYSLPLSAPAKRLGYGRHIESRHRMGGGPSYSSVPVERRGDTFCGLPIVIEHVGLDCLILDYRK